MKRSLAIGLAALLSLASAPAWADAIDGEWCSTDGKRLAIAGPAIVTPGGTKMTGNYDRHGFDFVIPAGEPGAGQKMIMVLLGEELMQSRIGASAPLSWKRCGKPNSALPTLPNQG